MEKSVKLVFKRVYKKISPSLPLAARLGVA